MGIEIIKLSKEETKNIFPGIDLSELKRSQVEVLDSMSFDNLSKFLEQLIEKTMKEQYIPWFFWENENTEDFMNSCARKSNSLKQKFERILIALFNRSNKRFDDVRSCLTIMGAIGLDSLPTYAKPFLIAGSREACIMLKALIDSIQFGGTSSDHQDLSEDESCWWAFFANVIKGTSDDKENLCLLLQYVSYYDQETFKRFKERMEQINDFEDAWDMFKQTDEFKQL